jgi:hypothetical protein
MKKLLIVSALLVLAMFKFSGCDSDDSKPEPDPEKEYLEQLSFTWHLQQVKVDGVDVTSAFNQLALTLKGDRTFTVTNPVAPIWPADGTFVLEEISGSGDYMIVRSDGVEIKVNELSTTTLRLQLQFEPIGGRVSSVGGQYEFLFAR